MEIYEQARVGKEGHAVTLLWADRTDEDDTEEGGPDELGPPGFGMRGRRK
ncbi:hypothetical protein [Defluviimonas sp. SAOS-178_SWC]